MIDLRAPARPEDLVGTTLSSRYRLTRLLGSGGMGGVYAALDEAGEPCAIKVVRGELAGEEASKRITREGKLATRLHGPHVVRVLKIDHDPERDLPFLVMPLLEGRDLAKLLEEKGALDPTVAVRLAIQACHGLEEAHALGIVHRDVKPSNLLLCDPGGAELVLKVGDFGIAKRLDHFDDTQLTHTGRAVGSPSYMSPEQAKGGEELDRRTDVWSLGATLYELLSGKTPWGDANSPSALRAALCTQVVPSLQISAPWVDASLAEVVHRALSLDRGQRWASAADFAAALAIFSEGTARIALEHLRAVDPAEKQRALARAAAEARLPERLSPRLAQGSDERVNPAPARRRALTPVAVSVLVVLMVIVLVLLSRR